MINFSLLKNYAFFADGAYVYNLPENPTIDSFKDKSTEQERIPEELVLDILGTEQDQWQIAHYYDAENETTGFAATVFRSGNQLVLAARGSENFLSSQINQDWIDTNLGGIGQYGVAVDQAVSLFNYIQRLRAPDGALNILQLDVEFFEDPITGLGTYTLSANRSGEGLGVIQSGDTIDTVGHSLGGHLAIVAKRLFPDLFDEAYSYNGANFGLRGEFFFSDVNDLLAENGEVANVTSSFSQISSSVTRVISEDSAPGDDINVVPGPLTGFITVGDEISLRTEKNSHSIGQMLDALTVQTLLHKISPSLSQSSIDLLFDTSSNDAALSQENIIIELSTLLLGVTPSLPKIEAGAFDPGDFDARVSFFESYSLVLNKVDDILQVSPGGIGLTVLSQVGNSLAELASQDTQQESRIFS